MVRFFSLKIFRCYECNREFSDESGIEIKHQR
jgi:hypothetical protein